MHFNFDLTSLIGVCVCMCVYVLMKEHACPGMHVEIRGQLLGGGFLLLIEAGYLVYNVLVRNC